MRNIPSEGKGISRFGRKEGRKEERYEEGE
jgi:hypothetical protein